MRIFSNVRSMDEIDCRPGAGLFWRLVRNGAAVCVMLLMLLALPALAGIDGDRPAWLEVTAPEAAPLVMRKLESGLEYGEFHMPAAESQLAVLRIDPEIFDFVLCAADEKGSEPMTLGQWVKQEKLTAAINASMYLPDNRTSTGYMRQGAYINNNKMAAGFGAFLVAGPRREGLPRAALLERGGPGWPGILDQYELVIQNFRMINSQRRVLWEKAGPRNAISAVAQDGAGHILFLHASQPVDVRTFANELLKLPLDIRLAMYVEGGAQSGLVVESGDTRREIGAPHAPSFIITGNLRAVLPNALGIRPRILAEK